LSRILAESFYSVVSAYFPHPYYRGRNDHEDIPSRHSFKLLERILDEQCQVEGYGDDCRATVKEPNVPKAMPLQSKEEKSNLHRTLYPIL
jgi:hypothetical protein